jgi:isopentenyl-diphosphate delta-isomerase
MQRAQVTIEDRKADHVRLAVATSGRVVPDAFGEIRLVHDALPELDRAGIDSTVTLVGRRLALPLVIASMTGGHPDGGRINRDLALVAAARGVAMGVGSQRAALVDRRLRSTYSAAREAAPSAVLFANIGAAQLVPQRDRPALTVEEVRELVDMIAADALVIHLNALQETVQREGDRDARGWTAALGRLVEAMPIPVIAKETGAGVSEEVARRVAAVGVAAIDVGGAGGTDFAAIEAARATEAGDADAAALGETLTGWGIPTPASVVLAVRAGVPVIATGGVRSGLDAAKAIALGAISVGVARPLLQAVLDDGVEGGTRWVDRFAGELATGQFLTGSPDDAALRRAPVVMSPSMRAWIEARPIGEATS